MVSKSGEVVHDRGAGAHYSEDSPMDLVNDRRCRRSNSSHMPSCQVRSSIISVPICRRWRFFNAVQVQLRLLL